MHEWSARKAFEHDLETLGAAAVYELVDLGRSAAWCADAHCRHRLVAPVVGQVHRDVESLEQLWCRGQVEYLLAQGRVRLISVPVGAQPRRDLDADANQQALEQGLAPHPVVVRVHASTGGLPDDGWVRWDGELELLAADEADAGAEPAAVLPRAHAPLEVGSTLPSRTLLHLLEDGAVWRWPYKSDRLWLLAAVGPCERSGWRIEPLSWERLERALAPDL